MRGARLERAVVLAVYVIFAAVALLVGFGAFAIYKMKPDWLKINAESRLARFSMELGRSDKPRDEPRELEPGRDGLRPCQPYSASPGFAYRLAERTR